MTRVTTVEWRKSRFSTADDKCVELGTAPGEGFVGIRDSKNPDGPTLGGNIQVSAFVTMVKANA